MPAHKSRNRTLKASFWASAQVQSCSLAARLLFMGMWNFSDDEGRGVVSPRALKASIFPADEIAADEVVELLGELERADLVRFYEDARGSRALYWITGWSRHQRPDRPSPSQLPAPDAGKPTTLAALVPVLDGFSTKTSPISSKNGTPPPDFRRKSETIRRNSEDFRRNSPEPDPEPQPSLSPPKPSIPLDVLPSADVPSFGSGRGTGGTIGGDGGRKLSESVSSSPPNQTFPPRISRSRAELDALRERLLDAAPELRDRAASAPGLIVLTPITELLDKGYRLEEDVLPVIRVARRFDVRSWMFFVPAIVRERERLAAQIPVAPPVAATGPAALTAADWDRRVELYRQKRTWFGHWGDRDALPADVRQRLDEIDAAPVRPVTREGVSA